VSLVGIHAARRIASERPFNAADLAAELANAITPIASDPDVCETQAARDTIAHVLAIMATLRGEGGAPSQRLTRRDVF